MTTHQIAVYGAGGGGQEFAWQITLSAGPDGARYDVVCFIDDNPAAIGTAVNDIPVLALDDALARFPAARVVGGIGSPRIREITTQKAAAAGFAFETIIHPQVEYAPRWTEVGSGTLICSGTSIMPNVRLGRHVQINLHCTIGHDVIMGDYTTLFPGAHISGWVHFGQRVLVGAGAVIVNGTADAPIIIGDDVTIGAAACVTKSIPSGLTVVGVPARPLTKTN